MTELADFIPVMRAVLHDNDLSGAGYDYTDAQLEAAVRAAWLLQQWPDGYDLDDDGNITPDISGNDFGIAAIQSVIVMMVGQQGAYSFRTRPISETDHGERKRDILQFCETRLAQLRDGSAVFSTRQGLLAWLDGGGYAATIEAAPPPPPAIAIPAPFIPPV